MPGRLNTAVLISGGGTNLQAIIDHLAATDTPCNIARVISNNPDAYGLVRAERAGIVTGVVNHRDYPDRAGFDTALRDTLEAAGVEAVILAGFMRILTDAFVERFRGRMLNIHPSLLPALKGLDTHRRAIDEGHAEHGASVHFVTPALDDGPVILRGRLRVRPDDTAETLETRVHRLEHRIYPLAVEWMARGRLEFRDHCAWLDGRRLPPCGEEIHEESI